VATPAPAQRNNTFGEDAFGRRAERAARFFGTPGYILGQTIVVVVWIAINAAAVTLRWDPYPFILLNLAFSTQAAYAAPLILLAQTRQTDRDKEHADAIERHHDAMEKLGRGRIEEVKRETDELRALLRANTELTQQDKELTEQVAKLAREIQATLAQKG
jgi:uncharacterized membrane protein